MKVIFLDIDGVMNSNVFYYERSKTVRRRIRRAYYWCVGLIRLLFTDKRYKTYSFANHKTDPKHFEFDYTFKRLKEETDPKKWKWLSDCCNANNFKICISSVWKHHFRDEQDWEVALLKLGFIPFTFVGITGDRRTDRGQEIKEWLEQNDVERYAIIDDDRDMLPEQMDSFFHVDGYYGLTPNTVYRITRHLNAEHKQ